MSRTLRTALVSTAALAGILGLASPALADDTHHQCSGTVACTGNIVDIHDIPVTVTDVVVRVLTGL